MGRQRTLEELSRLEAEQQEVGRGDALARAAAGACSSSESPSRTGAARAPKAYNYPSSSRKTRSAGLGRLRVTLSRRERALQEERPLAKIIVIRNYKRKKMVACLP